MLKHLPANAGDVRDLGSIPGSGRSSGGGNDNLLQYSCLGNPTDRGARRATVHGVAWSQTRLKRLSTHVLNKNCNKNFFEACPFFIKNKCICIWS